MSTRSISEPTIKRLFADSNGICARCNENLFPNGDNIAEICHIEAYSSGGSRFNKILKKEGKENEYENLIILCSNCHIIIDKKGNEQLYDAPSLRLMKDTHIKENFSSRLSKFDEKSTKIILKRFSLSIENELAEIRSLLESIVGNNCFELLKIKFKKNKVFSFTPSFKNINSFLFSKADTEIITTIKKGTELKTPQSYILEGPPSSGKTTIIIKLANELPGSFHHFYISLHQEHSLDSIRKDLRYIQSFEAILYVDDCHLNNNFACEIYNSCCDYSNLTLIFLYREIGNIERISDNGDNLFVNTVSQIFKIDPFDNQNEKINTLIEIRKKTIFEKTNIEAEVGNINIVNNTINKNLLKLSLLLDEWEKQPTVPLEGLHDKELNKLLFKRFLNTRYNKDEVSFLKIYTAINTFEIPFRILDNTKLEAQLLTDALVNKTEGGEFEFFHSSFSNLLMLSIISNETIFDLEYPNGVEEFLQLTFKRYFKLMSEKNAKNYPAKIAFSLTKLLANRQFDLYKFLVKDEETKQQIVSYFKDTPDIDQYSLFFKQISTSSSNQFEFYYNKLIDKNKIAELLNLTFKNIVDLRTVLVILRKKSYEQFKNAVYKLSITERKRIILSSKLKDIINTLQFIFNFDQPFAKFLSKDFTVAECASILNQNSVSLVTKSVLFFKQLRASEFIEEISKLLDKQKIIANSRFESLEKLAKSIKELTSLNRDLAKWFASSISENEIIDKIKNQPIDKISKSFKELEEFKSTEIYNIIEGFNDDYLLSEFRKTSLSITGKSLSDFFDINDTKIKKLVIKKEFQDLLLLKLSIEMDAGQVAKIIADLKKIEPKSAKLFLSEFTFDKIKTLVKNANLQKLGEFIYNIFRTNGFAELGENIFLSIPSKVIASKVLDAKFGITNYDAPFSQLSNVNWDKTIEVLELIENNLFINQAVGFKSRSVPADYARKISFSFKSLNDLVPKKINKIIFKIFKSISFDKKIDSLSKTDLLHCYANFASINPEYANNKFKDRVVNLNGDDIKNENISAFSDGLRLLKAPLQLTKDSFIIKTF